MSPSDIELHFYLITITPIETNVFPQNAHNGKKQATFPGTPGTHSLKTGREDQMMASIDTHRCVLMNFLESSFC